MSGEITTIAEALRDQVAGDPTKLASGNDVAVVHAPLGRLRVAYIPARFLGQRPVVVLAPGSQEHRDPLLTIALAHHYLRHRAQAVYGYTDEGPAFDDPLEAAEARRFYDVFTAIRYLAPRLRARRAAGAG